MCIWFGWSCGWPVVPHVALAVLNAQIGRVWFAHGFLLGTCCRGLRVEKKCYHLSSGFIWFIAILSFRSVVLVKGHVNGFLCKCYHMHQSPYVCSNILCRCFSSIYLPINMWCIAMHLDNQLSGKLYGPHYALPSLILHPLVHGSHALKSELPCLPCQGWAMTKRKAWQVRLESRIDPTEGGPGST